MLGLGLGLTFSRVGGESTPSFFDQFGTPAAAYSLRDLSGSNPNVIEVRRSSDNAVQDFTASEITDGSLTTWVGAGNDGFVRTWYDQAGANDATQTTAANQPKIVNAGSVVLENGLPTVKYDTIDKILIASSAATSVTNLTIISANSAFNGSNLADGAITQWNIDASNHISTGYRDGGYFTRVSKASAVSTLNGYDFSDNNLNLLFNYIDFTSVSNQIYVDNVLGSDLNAGRSNFDSANDIILGNRALGGASPLINMTEILFYTEDKSSDRTAIQTNINDYYSIY